jgi:hypothetical protein
VLASFGRIAMYPVLRQRKRMRYVGADVAPTVDHERGDAASSSLGNGRFTTLASGRALKTAPKGLSTMTTVTSS